MIMDILIYHSYINMYVHIRRYIHYVVYNICVVSITEKNVFIEIHFFDFFFSKKRDMSVFILYSRVKCCISNTNFIFFLFIFMKYIVVNKFRWNEYDVSSIPFIFLSFTCFVILILLLSR